MLASPTTKAYGKGGRDRGGIVADRLERVRESLGHRFRVERELGHSGMAAVFLAHDPRRDALVALKVLQPEFAVTIGVERFHREIQFVARLRHPNILPLLESDEAGPVIYYVTPFATGGSLRDRLLARTPLSVDEALTIVRQLAAALDYAHEQKVVHRDIKPGNILFEGDHVLLSDFGIARALQLAGADTLSPSGVVIGTPTYMSPEQAAASRKLDGRSDIYSLGCVLYEMLAGQPPFTGPTVQAVIARHAREHPPRLRVVRPDVPEAVAAGLERAMAKRPKDRPRSGAALMHDLTGG
jgi:serine/threonine protein kinase